VKSRAAKEPLPRNSLLLSREPGSSDESRSDLRPASRAPVLRAPPQPPLRDRQFFGVAPNDLPERLTIIREHVGKAQVILAEFIDPKSGAEGPVAMKRLVNRLKHHLDNRELVRALSESDGEQEIEQADAKVERQSEARTSSLGAP
jgi:hypothetical protein